MSLPPISLSVAHINRRSSPSDAREDVVSLPSCERSPRSYRMEIKPPSPYHPIVPPSRYPYVVGSLPRVLVQMGGSDLEVCRRAQKPAYPRAPRSMSFEQEYIFARRIVQEEAEARTSVTCEEQRESTKIWLKFLEYVVNVLNGNIEQDEFDGRCAVERAEDAQRMCILIEMTAVATCIKKRFCVAIEERLNELMPTYMELRATIEKDEASSFVELCTLFRRKKPFLERAPRLLMPDKKSSQSELKPSPGTRTSPPRPFSTLGELKTPPHPTATNELFNDFLDRSCIEEGRKAWHLQEQLYSACECLRSVNDIVEMEAAARQEIISGELKERFFAEGVCVDSRVEAKHKLKLRESAEVRRNCELLNELRKREAIFQRLSDDTSDKRMPAVEGIIPSPKTPAERRVSVSSSCRSKEYGVVQALSSVQRQNGDHTVCTLRMGDHQCKDDGPSSDVSQSGHCVHGLVDVVKEQGDNKVMNNTGGAADGESFVHNSAAHVEGNTLDNPILESLYVEYVSSWLQGLRRREAPLQQSNIYLLAAEGVDVSVNQECLWLKDLRDVEAVLQHVRNALPESMSKDISVMEEFEWLNGISEAEHAICLTANVFPLIGGANTLEEEYKWLSEMRYFEDTLMRSVETCLNMQNTSSGGVCCFSPACTSVTMRSDSDTDTDSSQSSIFPTLNIVLGTVLERNPYAILRNPLLAALGEAECTQADAEGRSASGVARAFAVAQNMPLCLLYLKRGLWMTEKGFADTLSSSNSVVDDAAAVQLLQAESARRATIINSQIEKVWALYREAAMDASRLTGTGEGELFYIGLHISSLLKEESAVY
uniref:Uncharacterized protein n=1 Tax=Trypanosoma vivax (strain Y486) TaxID=1055687 RepID=G0U911_TRYVY|nr:conserved hypothetical protein, fragment [Trypanosoma vivax Y486]